ncbi:cold shock domain-containing protein [Raoultella planticola]|nr:cold shock domain-containing protein [Raoultella planticola]MCD9604444.1 cold shock domain-containing protein [Raoultella planticola]
MDGIVKWFSEEQGYGFITDKANNDYYFHISNVKGTLIPKNGQYVYFDIEDNKAKNISLTHKKENTFKILSSDYRKTIFDLYKDTFTCITIAVLGVFLIRNNYHITGWLTYSVACALAILASFTTIKLVEEKRKSKEASRLSFIVFLLSVVFSIIILVSGLLKGVKEFL